MAPADRLSTLPEGEPEFTLGWEAIRWAESWLIQPNGPRSGQKLRFTRDQLRYLLWWYAMHPDGQWIYAHGVRRLAKGSGKSPFAAVMCLLEFCGPVRLARKDHRLPGGCAGKPVDMPWVQIAATAESQTKNTMRMVRAFAPKGSPIVTEYGLDPGKTVYYKVPEGTLEIITSSATAAEGAEASFAVEDETEHSKPSNGGPEFIATLEDNLAKSGARSLETANAWVPGAECVAEASWDAWVAQEEGRLREEAGLILYDARIAPPEAWQFKVDEDGREVFDVEALAAGLQWVYGDCDWKKDADGNVDVRPMIKSILSPRSKPSEAKRKYLNRPTVLEDAWVAPEDWAKLIDLDRVVSATEPVALFFDGSKSRDATALVGCCLDDGHVFVPRVLDRWTIWEPNPAHDSDDVVPVTEVDAAVSEVFRTLNVVAFFGDVQEWESFVKIDWPNRFGDRLIVKAVPAGKDPQTIAWDMRSHVFDFTQSAELAEAEILEQKFTHDGNPVLQRHVANCRRRPNRYGVSVGKESPSSAKKIDAGVCVIGVRMVRRLALAAKPKSEHSGIVYL